MSEKEKAQIMETIKNLPESSKQFVLGYAAGRLAGNTEETKAPEEKSV